MDLKEFVTTTLVQIAEGSKDAQQAVADAGGVVNPAIEKYNQDAPSYFGTLNAMRHVFLVDFDVAVSVVEDTEKKAGARLQVASVLNLGGSGESSHSSSLTNRLAFKVPLALPIDGKTEADLQARRAASAAAVRRYNQGSDF